MSYICLMQNRKIKNTFTFRFNKMSQNRGLTWFDLESFAQKSGITMNEVVIDALVRHLGLENTKGESSRLTAREIERLIDKKLTENRSFDDIPVYRQPE